MPLTTNYFERGGETNEGVYLRVVGGSSAEFVSRFSHSSRRRLAAIVLTLFPLDLRDFSLLLLLRFLGFPIPEFLARSVTSIFCILCPCNDMLSESSLTDKLACRMICFCDGAKNKELRIERERKISKKGSGEEREREREIGRGAIGRRRRRDKSVCSLG